MKRYGYIGLALMLAGLLLMGWGLNAQDGDFVTNTPRPAQMSVPTQYAPSATAASLTLTARAMPTATATALPTERAPDMVWRIERARVRFDVSGGIVLEVWRVE